METASRRCATCGVSFMTDVVVFEDYTIHEGMVIPHGAVRARYAPETCPALPQQLARLTRAIRPPRWLCPHLWVIGLYTIGRSCRPRAAQPRTWGSPCLDLGSGRDGRVVSAPDVWAPDRRRCHAA